MAESIVWRPRLEAGSCCRGSEGGWWQDGVGCQCQCGEGHDWGDSIIIRDMVGPVIVVIIWRGLATASEDGKQPLCKARQKSGGVKATRSKRRWLTWRGKPPGWVTRDSFGCQAPQSVDRPYRQHANHAPGEAGLRGVLSLGALARPTSSNGRFGAPHPTDSRRSKKHRKCRITRTTRIEERRMAGSMQSQRGTMTQRSICRLAGQFAGAGRLENGCLPEAPH